MAREIFRDWKPGERLTAEHINLLNEAARLIMSIHPTAFSHGHHGSRVGLEPFQQRVVIVTDDTDQSAVKVKYRYYASSGEVWETDNDAGEYLLDAESVGTYAFDDEVFNAYWDPQAQRFLPVDSNKPILAKTTVCHPLDETHPVAIYKGTKGSEAETEYEEDAYNRFADIQNDEWVLIQKVNGEYEIIAANPCPGSEPQC